MNRILLCTFAHKSNLQLATHYINQNYNPTKQFVFHDSNNPVKLFITYNTTIRHTNTADTILIHRKPDTSTLYTINALNALIIKINNGILDKTYELDWFRYQNSIILVSDNEVVVTPLTLFKII